MSGSPALLNRRKSFARWQSAAGVIALIATGTFTIPGAAMATSPGAAATTSSCGDDGLGHLYVAERGAGRIAVFRSDARGSVGPVRAIGGDGSGVQDPWGVALDDSKNLYVQNFLSQATTEVFGPDAAGAAAPTRVLQGVLRDSPAVAVDSTGQIYAARVQQGSIEVFGPGAVAGSRPTRTILTDGTPRSLAVDAANNLIAAVQGRGGMNAIEIFAPDANGAATPIRMITGPSTGLGRSVGSMGPGETVVVTDGKTTGRIYAAVTGATPDPGIGLAGSISHVSVFTSDADGDAQPVRTIAGPATDLTGTTLTGVADNPASGNIWVMTGIVGSNGVIASGQVVDFDRLADGDVAPVGELIDATNGFIDVQGIAFGNR